MANIHLAKNLQHLIDTDQITVVELSKKSGISRFVIYSALDGTNIGIDKLSMLSKGLGISAEILLHSDLSSQGIGKFDEQTLDDKTWEVLKHYGSLPPERQYEFNVLIDKAMKHMFEMELYHKNKNKQKESRKLTN